MPSLEQAARYLDQAQGRLTDLEALLPRAQLGGSYAAEVGSTLRSLRANLESVQLELQALAPPPAP